MARETAADRALREREDEEKRLNDVRRLLGLLKTQDARLTVIAEVKRTYNEVAEAEARRADPSGPVAANDVPVVQASKGEQAEAYVLHKGRGVAPAVIGASIGTTGRGADDALREIARKRKTVERAGGKWYPAGTVPATALTIGMVIAKVMEDGAELSTADIHERVEKLAKGTKKTSVAVEITRLVTNGTLETRGQAPHSKGYLYVLAKGGAAATAAR